MYFEKVKELIVKEMNCDPNKITMDTNFVDDLGADSLDAVELIVNIESEFGVSIDQDDAVSFQTVGDVVRLLEKLKK